jgi:hypothetical protein
MERKSNENTIKKVLLKKLLEITVSSDSDGMMTSVLLANNTDKTEITVSRDYSIEKFRFQPGQFIQIEYGCSCHRRDDIALCVGVGKGCPDNEEIENLWFLMEEDEGISHFCGAGVKEFNKWEEEGSLILLEPIS